MHSDLGVQLQFKGPCSMTDKKGGLKSVPSNLYFFTEKQLELYKVHPIPRKTNPNPTTIHH